MIAGFVSVRSRPSSCYPTEFGKRSVFSARAQRRGERLCLPLARIEALLFLVHNIFHKSAAFRGKTLQSTASSVKPTKSEHESERERHRDSSPLQKNQTKNMNSGQHDRGVSGARDVCGVSSNSEGSHSASRTTKRSEHDVKNAEWKTLQIEAAWSG